MKLGWAVTSMTRVVTSITINVTANSKVITLVIFDVWGKANLGANYFLSLLKVLICLQKEQWGWEYSRMQPNIGGLSVWKWLHVTLSSPRILRWPLDFWKICTRVLETRSWCGAGNIGGGGGSGGSSSNSSSSSSSGSSRSSKCMLTGHNILNIKKEVRNH